MKKIIISIIALGFIGTVVLLSYFYFEAEKNRAKSNDQSQVNPEVVTVKGESIAIFGYREGDKAILKLSDECNIGDICDFFCISEKCEPYRNADMIKVVTKKTGKFYWLEGRNDKFNITDKGFETSFDSINNYGWMESGKDIQIKGVIMGKYLEHENSN